MIVEGTDVLNDCRTAQVSPKKAGKKCYLLSLHLSLCYNSGGVLVFLKSQAGCWSNLWTLWPPLYWEVSAAGFNSVCPPVDGASYLLCVLVNDVTCVSVAAKQSWASTGGAREAQTESCRIIHEESRQGHAGTHTLSFRFIKCTQLNWMKSCFRESEHHQFLF